MKYLYSGTKRFSKRFSWESFSNRHLYSYARKKFPRVGISLRARLTFVTVLIITLIAVLLTFSSMTQLEFFSGAVMSAGEATATEPYDISAEQPPSTVYDSAGSQAAASGDATVAGQAASGSTAYDSSGQAAESPMAAVTQATEQAARSFNRWSLIIMVLIILAGGFAAYFIIGGALRPVRRLSEEIAAVSENALDTRVSCPPVSDEIGRLAASFNTLLLRLEKAFESQKNFSSAAAHELKTPLTAIKANIDVLELDSVPAREEYERTVKVVKGQSERMIKLVDDLFAMTMRQENIFEDEIHPVELIENILQEFQPNIAERALEVSVKNFYSKRLCCNEVMLRRLFTNIILNAVKYNFDGGRIDITILENERSCMISVADTGLGIPDEHLENIFEPFYRVDKSRSRRLGGSGLGLAIAKDMAEKHGGSIQVWPNVNGGSVFTVELPKVRAE